MVPPFVRRFKHCGSTSNRVRLTEKGHQLDFVKNVEMLKLVDGYGPGTYLLLLKRVVQSSERH
jgi:hypothetical protein